jgi:hypothetical protein
MKKNNYYLHINSGSLAHYLRGGCIKPSVLLNNRERDFQDNCSDKIIVSTKKWNKDSDCSVEVILSPQEVKTLEKIGSDYLLFNSILPISRIKTIFFTKKEIAKDIEWKINSTSAFLPIRIVKVDKPLLIETSKENFNFQNTRANNIEALKVKLKRFDRLMGGIAFMRTSLNCIEDKKINFSENYFDTISYFNNYIRNEVKSSNIKINEFFHDIFSLKAPIVNFLNKKIDFSIVEKIANEESISLKSNFGVLSLDNIPHNSLSFKLAILNTFGTEESKSVESLIEDLFPKLTINEGEEIALLFGLYKGYNSIRNYYKFSNKKVIAKFELNSNIDYYIIETLFQYSFNTKELNDSFDWLVQVMPNGIEMPVSYDYKSFNIFGNTVVLGKNDYSNYLNEILEKMSNEIGSWFPKNIISIDKETVSEKLKSIIKPSIRQMVKEVQLDVSRNIAENELINKSKEKIEIKELTSKDNILDSKSEKDNSTPSKKSTNCTSQLEKETNVIKQSQGTLETKGRIESNDVEIDKESNTVEPDLFNATSEEPLNKTDSPAILNAKELSSKTIKQLKKYADENGIKIQRGITKKGDIIKFILSN